MTACMNRVRTRKVSAMPKKELTLRQRLLVGGFVMLCVCTVWSYVLASCGLDPNAEVTTTCINLYGGVYVAYVAADTMDHNSLNKYGGNNHA